MRSSMLAWLLFVTSLQAIPAGGSISKGNTLFTQRRPRSPRVLFSAQAPAAAPPGVGVRAGAGGGRPARSPGSPGGRTRRVAQGTGPHRGVFSVCDSISAWVVNKTHATDISGHEVTVLPNVNVNSVNKKQYFFETSCLGGGGGGGGGAAGAAGGTGVSSCLGIDARRWNSYCTNSHTFVRALTTYRNLVAWRHIRINVACECVVSRKSWAKS
ncbi:unnamed protein product [Arctogadus glacialis]